jgi:hypothetical protein
MTNPIRAALEEAWHESPSFLVDLPQGRVRQSLSLEETAKVIHDFLRALTDSDVLALLSAEKNQHHGWRDTLAQAVLAAAKDQAND